ncbi:hypothetical protein BaRGS_00034498 [Batillaria attramentaria]|uniref:Uncharacterized protein n=1 Tax=Batillaria attramentaria TaxID=370345 RepID=A0ABD0JHR8_9CAEN
MLQNGRLKPRANGRDLTKSSASKISFYSSSSRHRKLLLPVGLVRRLESESKTDNPACVCFIQFKTLSACPRKSQASGVDLESKTVREPCAGVHSQGNTCPWAHFPD